MTKRKRWVEWKEKKNVECLHEFAWAAEIIPHQILLYSL